MSLQDSNTGKKSNATVIALYALLTFPLFYFVYKYNTPYLGMIDFFDYYKLYENLDYRAADSPLNMRLVSSFLVWCLQKTGLSYNTVTAIDQAEFSKAIYFNAILVNYACVVATCTVIFNILRNRLHSVLMSFAAGALYLLGFGTVFYELTPLADAMAVLLFAVVWLFYLKQSKWIVVPMLLLIFQREYLFLALGLIALVDYIKKRDNYFLFAFVLSVLCFSSYIIMRKTVFETERYSHHTNVEFMLTSLNTSRFPFLPFLRQTAMTLNIFIIYLAVIMYKFRKKMLFNRFELFKSSLLLAQIIVLAYLLSLGNNAGRYFYMLVPMHIVLIADELRALKLQS